MSRRGPVLVGFDFTGSSEAALQQGFEVARDSHGPLIVGHVLPEAFRTRVLFPHQAGTDADERARVEQRATSAIIAHLTKTLDVLPEVARETGTPHAGLLSLAGRFKAGPIGVGPGKVAQHMARSAEQPVLVARPSPERGVVRGATDSSDPALPAVRAAAEEAARRQPTLRLLHCLDVDPPVRLAHDSKLFSFPEFSNEAFASLEQEARATERGAGRNWLPWQVGGLPPALHRWDCRVGTRHGDVARSRRYTRTHGPAPADAWERRRTCHRSCAMLCTRGAAGQ